MFGIGTLSDLLRLAAPPIFAWTAVRDVHTRCVPSIVWYSLATLDITLFAWRLLGHFPPKIVLDRLYLIRVGASVCLIVPLSYLFWRLDSFGDADAKMLMVFVVLLPTSPSYTPAGTEFSPATIRFGIFSMTALTNTVIVDLVYPLFLAARNLADGEFEFPASSADRCISVTPLSTAHGRLFESPEDVTWSGLDLDAFRMYLRWHDFTFVDLLTSPETPHDPDSIGEVFDPTDGTVHRAVTGGGALINFDDDSETAGAVGGDAPGDDDCEADSGKSFDDPWGVVQSPDSTESSVYGTPPEKLRGGLDFVMTCESVWISPSIPFLAPMFVSLVVVFTYGDVLFGVPGAPGVI